MNPFHRYTRRHFLRTSTIGFGTPPLLRSHTKLQPQRKQARSHRRRRAFFPPRRSGSFFLFMSGAPSHVDMFDYKPELAKRNGEEVSYGRAQSKLMRSPWDFKQHGQSGQWISELMPHLARHADDLCILNGMTTPIASHTGGVPMMHTGNFQTVRPSMGRGRSMASVRRIRICPDSLR